MSLSCYPRDSALTILISKKLKDAQALVEDPGQDHTWSQRSSKEKYKKASQKLFARTIPKDHPTLSSTPENASGDQPEANDTVPLEDAVGSPPEWNTMSTLGDIFTMPSASSVDTEELELLLCVTYCLLLHLAICLSLPLRMNFRELRQKCIL